MKIKSVSFMTLLRSISRRISSKCLEILKWSRALKERYLNTILAVATLCVSVASVVVSYKALKSSDESLIAAKHSLYVAQESLVVSQDTFKYKSEEDMLSKKNILIDIPSNKIVPNNILYSLRIYTSIEFVKSILGVPEIVGDKTIEYFDVEDWEDPSPYAVYSYFFKNADVKIISKDNKTISAVVIQRGSEDHPIDIPQMENVSLGKVTVGKMLDICGGKADREVSWLGRGDVTYVAQCYFGRWGQYLWYSFGYFDPEGYDIETDVFEHKNFENKKVQFFTISSSPRFASSVLEKSLHEIIIGR